MEGKKLGGLVLLIVGIAMLIYVFYQGNLLFSRVPMIDFQASGQLSIPSPVGDVPLDIPGIGSFPFIMRAIVEVMYLGLLIGVGSKIAGIGINLLKKT